MGDVQLLTSHLARISHSYTAQYQAVRRRRTQHPASQLLREWLFNFNFGGLQTTQVLKCSRALLYMYGW